MKIDLIREEEVDSEGLEVSALGFDMSKTAKLFHMLSSTLYSDKQGSIVRELCSNAYDSHKEAGKLDVHFDIFAPTYEVPTLRIRDYGVGLTKEEAEKTILCYLGSSKDNSDDMIGGWGIGSKSPFAYAMNYEVKVFKEGKFAYYQCWKDESGIPNKALIDSGATDEPNGVLISVPVESEDIAKFSLTLRSYLSWTNYNVVLHIHEETILPRSPVASKDFGDYKVHIYREGKGLRKLVYGGFSYEMNECVEDRYDYSSTWSKISNSLNSNYDVAFVIDTPNAVTFNMNREVLEQTKKSQEFIKKMLDSFYEYSNKRKEIIDKNFNTWVDNTKDTANLGEVNKKVEEINKEISAVDNEFSFAFTESFFTLTYIFKGKGFNTITSGGKYPAYYLRFGLSPVEDQIKVAYSHRASPPPKDRRYFIASTGKNKTILYFKAKTVDEVKNILRKSEDFVGVDIDSLEYVEVPLTVKPRAVPSRTKSSNPVLYCDYQKRRLPYKYGWIYVACDDPEKKKESLTFEQEAYNKEESNNVVFFQPSKNTSEKYGSHILTFDEYEEKVEEWMEERVQKFLPPKFVDTVCRYFNSNSLSSSLNKELSDIRSLCRQSGVFFSTDRSLRKFYNYLWERCDKNKYKDLKKRFREFKKKAEDYKNVVKIVNFWYLRVNKDSELSKLIIDYLDKEGIDYGR